MKIKNNNRRVQLECKNHLKESRIKLERYLLKMVINKLNNKCNLIVIIKNKNYWMYFRYS